MQPHLERLIKARSDRAVASILGVAERECRESLTAEQWAALRKVVRDTILNMRNFTTDIVESLDTGDIVLNDLYLDKIDEIHRQVTAGRTSSNGRASTNGHRSPSEFGGGRPVTPV